jgi:hypothetical protein
MALIRKILIIDRKKAEMEDIDYPIIRIEQDYRCASCAQQNSDVCWICTPTQGGFGSFHKD